MTLHMTAEPESGVNAATSSTLVATVCTENSSEVGKCCFLALPPELRICIYELVMGQRQPAELKISPDDKGGQNGAGSWAIRRNLWRWAPCEPCMLDLVVTSKAIYQDVKPLLVESLTCYFSIKDHELADGNLPSRVEKLRSWKILPHLRTVKLEVWLVDDNERSDALVEVLEGLGKDLTSGRNRCLRAVELCIGWHEDTPVRNIARVVTALCDWPLSKIEVAKLWQIGPLAGFLAHEPKQVTIEQFKHAFAKTLADGFWDSSELSSESDDTSGSDVDSGSEIENDFSGSATDSES